MKDLKHLLYFESTSDTSGAAQITATFKPGTDPDMAQVDVQNRLKKAEARLPRSVLTQGIQVEQATSNFLMIYALKYKGDDAGKDAQRVGVDGEGPDLESGPAR